MKKFKKFLSAALAFALLIGCIFLPGCSFFQKNGVSFTGYSNKKDIQFNYSANEYKRLAGLYESALQAAEDESLSLEEMSRLFYNISYYETRLADQFQMARLCFYSNTQSASSRAGYERMLEYIQNIENASKKLLAPMAESQYKEFYYGDMTDEEIAEYIARNNPSEAALNLSTRISDMETEDSVMSDTARMSDAYVTLYANYVDARNDYSALNGYANYIDDCYENDYCRDFQPADTIAYTNALKTNMLPLSEKAAEKASLNGKSATFRNYAASYYNFLETPFTDSQARSVLDGFYRSLGTEIYGIYTHLINDGYYYIAQGGSAQGAAFTSYFRGKDEPYIFFSASGSGHYCSLITFVHEFGHYCNFYKTKNGSRASMEIMETQSQGAEWLFLSYYQSLIEGTNIPDAEGVAEWVIAQYFLRDSLTVYLAAIVGAAEAEIYPKEAQGITYDIDEILNRYTENAAGVDKLRTLYSIGISPAQYFRYVAIDSPGYYISYSVSLISSYQFYVAGRNNYQVAAQTYSALLPRTKDYMATLSALHINSPFAAGTYTALYAALFGTE